MKKPPLTDLENHALAHLDHSGPMTGYRLRRLFASSPTNSIAASQGAIYPLLARLERRGLILASKAVDDRGSRLLRCSASGRRAVKRWLADASAGGHLAEDGLRSRAYFIERLEPDDCLHWLLESLQACRAKQLQLDSFRQQHPETRGSRWAQAHAEGALQLRIAWLNQCIDEMENPAQ